MQSFGRREILNKSAGLHQFRIRPINPRWGLSAQNSFLQKKSAFVTWSPVCPEFPGRKFLLWGFVTMYANYDMSKSILLQSRTRIVADFSVAKSITASSSISFMAPCLSAIFPEPTHANLRPAFGYCLCIITFNQPISLILEDIIASLER